MSEVCARASNVCGIVSDDGVPGIQVYLRDEGQGAFALDLYGSAAATFVADCARGLAEAIRRSEAIAETRRRSEGESRPQWVCCDKVHEVHARNSHPELGDCVGWTEG